MIFPRTVWINGKWLDPRRPVLSIFDRGFANGEGVFETLRIYSGRTFRFGDHFERLKSSARGIALRVPITAKALHNIITALLRRNNYSDAAIRITLTRGVGPRGYDPRECKVPTLAVVALPLPRRPEALYRRGIAVVIARTRRYPKEALNPAIKSTSALNNALAFREALRRKASEAIMLNTKGFLSEGTASNLFFISGMTLKTPALKCGLLAGVTRSVVLEIAKREGLKIKEGTFRPKDLLKSDEAFITSSTVEIMPVTQVTDQAGRPHKIGTGRPGLHTALLLGRYREMIGNCVENSSGELR